MSIDTLQLAPVVSAPRAPHRITVAEFELLSDAGFVAKRTELIDGEIFDMAAMGNAHSLATMDLARLLMKYFDSPWFVRVQSTQRFDANNAPEPDIALLPSRPVHKALVDVLPALVVEVSDTTLAEDLGRKRLLYARFGVPEYWVADVNRRLLYVFRSPNAAATAVTDAYADEAILKDDGVLSPLAKPDAVIRVADFMPNAG